MGRKASFWRNVAIIGFVHIAIVSAVMRWSGAPRKAPPSNILWMDGGAALPEAAVAAVSNPTAREDQIIEPPAAEQDQDIPPAAVPESDINLPTATPRPKPVAT